MIADRSHTTSLVELTNGGNYISMREVTYCYAGSMLRDLMLYGPPVYQASTTIATVANTSVPLAANSAVPTLLTTGIAAITTVVGSSSPQSSITSDEGGDNTKSGVNRGTKSRKNPKLSQSTSTPGSPVSSNSIHANIESVNKSLSWAFYFVSNPFEYFVLLARWALHHYYIDRENKMKKEKRKQSTNDKNYQPNFIEVSHKMS